MEYNLEHVGVGLVLVRLLVAKNGTIVKYKMLVFMKLHFQHPPEVKNNMNIMSSRANFSSRGRIGFTLTE
jgi:hypothetical protein